MQALKLSNPPAEPDAELIALVAAAPSRRRVYQAQAAFLDAEDRAEHPPAPAALTVMQSDCARLAFGDRYGAEEVDRFREQLREEASGDFGADNPWRRRRRAIVEAFDAWQAEIALALAAAGATAAKARWDALEAESEAHRRRVIATPARSPAGLLAKLALAAAYFDDGELQDERARIVEEGAASIDDLFTIIAADARRMGLDRTIGAEGA
jgi:hypothetical protein